MTPAQIQGIFQNVTPPPQNSHTTPSQMSRIATLHTSRLKPLIPHRSPLIHMPDTADSTREFDFYLAADFYLTVYTQESEDDSTAGLLGVPALFTRDQGLREHQAFFDAQTKHKDKHYTPKLLASNVSEIAFVRFTSNFYSLLEDCPLFRVEYLLLPNIPTPMLCRTSKLFTQSSNGCGRNFIRPATITPKQRN